MTDCQWCGRLIPEHRGERDLRYCLFSLSQAVELQSRPRVHEEGP